MIFSTRLQLLTCLVVYASGAHAIMVKFGTKGGPIEPPAQERSLPMPQPYRAPAPVWEERSNDAPDPNAQWRPQLFKPEPRYTQAVYNNRAPAPPLPLNNAQRFVNSYIPAQPIHHQNQNYFSPSQVLSSQSLPGFGLRYFVPNYNNDSQRKIELRQEDAKGNHIERNIVDVGSASDSASDLQWKYEKDATKRNIRNTQEAVVLPMYLWPAYVPARHQ